MVLSDTLKAEAIEPNVQVIAPVALAICTSDSLFSKWAEKAGFYWSIGINLKQNIPPRVGTEYYTVFNGIVFKYFEKTE